MRSVAIVGAGFGGIAAAIGLLRDGLAVTLYERADDLGGVWRENTYPGAACDIPAYLYSLSYAQRRDWPQPCPTQPEIHGYLRDLAQRYGVRERIRFATEIVDARFDAAALRWTLRSAAGERVECDALVLACGQLSRPSWPRIEGAERFAGHSFHSAEWDHEHDLRGRRVAVIGTGASAIQFVPEIAEQVAELAVFQRTPPYLLPRRNRRYAGWARAAIRYLPGLQAARRYGIWAFGESGILGQTRLPAQRRLLWLWSRAHLRRHVKDPALRAKLTPRYPIGCKRVLFSSHYYRALQRPNVELVTEPIRAITRDGIVTGDDRERRFDTIVYGTGFRANDFVAPLAVHGLDGRELAHEWRDGAFAHLGITVAGFPNLFLIYGPNTNLGFGSIIVMIEAQVAYVRDALRRMRRHGIRALDVRADVCARSTEAIQQRLQRSVWSNCQSWYRHGADGRITNNWPGFMLEYVRATRALNPREYRALAPLGADD